MEDEQNNQLANFRHMVGIRSTKGFSGANDTTHNNLHFDRRAAPNLGIYNRVCHREAKAKRGFKLASMLINSCLGLQVVVAAALTAMGAANTNHVSITAFGAINTVIAGTLTYLKGSGLPNRIRWYENEWKRVREYIEQRERDFSLPNCRLNVQEVVAVIEAMYEEVKSDIQNNTPEAYVSLSDIRNRGKTTNLQIPKLQGLLHDAPSQGQNKLQELELKYGHKVNSFIENLTHKEEERLRRLEGELEATTGKVMQVGQDALQSGREWEKEMEEKGMRVTEREIEHTRDDLAQRLNDIERNMTAAATSVLQTGRDWEQDVENKGLQAIERELEHTRSDLYQGHLGLERSIETVQNNVAQLGRNVGQEVEARGALVTEVQRGLERGAQRAQETAEQAQASVHMAAASFQGFADSVQRIGKAVHYELPQNKQV